MDKPFRKICRALGASLAPSEMTLVRHDLLNTNKSKTRLNVRGERGPVSIQIAGSCVDEFVYGANYAQEHGADIVDLNMGCPNKKVCDKAAGSALLRDEQLVKVIIQAVVKNVEVPVTLKIRTGWDREHRNALNIAKIAEGEGIQLLVIHGRTRADKYQGCAEYETIANVVSQLNIPVIANGDINSAEQAIAVIKQTGAAGVMLGRGTQGNPWLVAEVTSVLAGGDIAEFSWAEKISLLLTHIQDVHSFYGEVAGVRMARKHIRWYLARLYDDFQMAWQRINRLDDTKAQYQMLSNILSHRI